MIKEVNLPSSRFMSISVFSSCLFHHHLNPVWYYSNCPFLVKFWIYWVFTMNIFLDLWNRISNAPKVDWFQTGSQSFWWVKLIKIFLSISIFNIFRRKKPLYGLSHHNKIWKPDIFLVKHGSYKVEPRIWLNLVSHSDCQNINPSEVSLRIFENGTVFYTMRRHLILNCEGDLPIFPFDSPMCDFNVESSECQIVWGWFSIIIVQFPTPETRWPSTGLDPML